MAVKLATKRKVKWPVTIAVPQDGGNTVKSSCSVEFEVLTQDDIERLNAEGKDLLDVAVQGWAGISLDDEEELAVSEENRKRLIAIPYVRAALFAAYNELQTGRAAARKN